MDDNQVEVLAIKYRDLLLQHHKWEREVNQLSESNGEMIRILHRLSEKDLVEFDALDYFERRFIYKG
jgi:hypothetical protein